MKKFMKDCSRKVILGVTSSDSHIVANHLISFMLRKSGFTVINLGACTPTEEFGQAFLKHPDCEGILIGSVNGHAYEDLKNLPEIREQFKISCPVILGGNLSVGSQKSDFQLDRFFTIGVDHILDSHTSILRLLDQLKSPAKNTSRVS
jgi:methylaspartate mutase sigma subunit